ncbi:hypothetical protein ABWH89_04865 [Hoeflea alexandrii]|uniref:hypothetical protein n=1 Tax=Hoeflea alexandrii TaxID=288436 RepID=UPI0035D07F3B
MEADQLRFPATKWAWLQAWIYLHGIAPPAVPKYRKKQCNALEGLSASPRVNPKELSPQAWLAGFRRIHFHSLAFTRHRSTIRFTALISFRFPACLNRPAKWITSIHFQLSDVWNNFRRASVVLGYNARNTRHLSISSVAS